MQLDQPSPNRSQTRTVLLIFGGCLVAVVCMACFMFTALIGFVVWDQNNDRRLAELLATSSPTPALVPTARPTFTIDPPATQGSAVAQNDLSQTEPTGTPAPNPAPTAHNLTPPDIIDQRPLPDRAYTDFELLLSSSYVAQDYYETAVRLGRRHLGERTVPASLYNIGDSQTFHVDDDTITATLVAVTDHAYFWIEEGLPFDQDDIDEAADLLETEYYPQLVNLFGEAWQPGIDNDPHFSILHISGSDSITEFGYFTSVDEFPRTLYSRSNEQEIIYLNMGQLDFGNELYYGTMVHEIQHLIHWHVDANETTWLNEGLSQLAEIYMGLDTVSSRDYLRNPQIQLNSWSQDGDQVFAHYSGTYLFSVYIWEQLGEAAVKELARHPANGMASVHSVLQGFQPERSLAQFTADWAVANLLDDPAAGPAYYYEHLDLSQPSFETHIKEPSLDIVNTLNQFGVNYIELDYRGVSTITFAGDTVAELSGTPPRSGSQMWLAPPANESSAQLTGEFDLSGLTRATLQFGTWYDLEEDFDFAYLSISTDGGLSWELLVPNHAQAGEFGPAFNGRSQDADDAVDDWVKETISLDNYVGRSVLIRFEVLTDYETDVEGLGRGFAIDDISISELGYQTDVEGGPDGWSASGFVQIGWQIPQQWSVQFIQNGPNPQVRELPLNELNQGQWAIEVDKGGGILVITALTPFIEETATYWLNIAP